MSNKNGDTIKYSIRPCKPDDLDAMREICIETSSLPLHDEKPNRDMNIGNRYDIVFISVRVR